MGSRPNGPPGPTEILTRQAGQAHGQGQWLLASVAGTSPTSMMVPHSPLPKIRFLGSKNTSPTERQSFPLPAACRTGEQQGTGLWGAVLRHLEEAVASGGPGRALQPPGPQACCTGTCVRAGAGVPARWADPGWVPWTSVHRHQHFPGTACWEARQNPEGASLVLCQPRPLLALGEAG